MNRLWLEQKVVSHRSAAWGACVMRVIEGEPGHRDMLTIASDDEFTPCRARALTPVLVRDL